MQQTRERKILLSAGCADRASQSPASGQPINPGIARPASRLSGSMIWPALACPRWPRDLRIRNVQLGLPGAQSNNHRGLYGVVCPPTQGAPSITPAKGPPSQAFARICRCFSGCFSGGLPSRWGLPPMDCRLGYFGLGTNGLNGHEASGLPLQLPGQPCPVLPTRDAFLVNASQPQRARPCRKHIASFVVP